LLLIGFYEVIIFKLRLRARVRRKIIWLRYVIRTTMELSSLPNGGNSVIVFRQMFCFDLPSVMLARHTENLCLSFVMLQCDNHMIK